MTRVTVRDVQTSIGVTVDGQFGDKSKTAFLAKLTNANPARLTLADFERTASDLRAPLAIVRAVNKVEAPRGAYDPAGRPTTLYERHVFARNSAPVGRFNLAVPDLSGGPYGRGGYGALSAQYGKLCRAMALDPHAALSACSWGAFQVLGENWLGMGYASPWDMVQTLATGGEPAHLESFARFVQMKGLEDELRACKPGDPESCVPFVRGYNGAGFREFNYHVSLSDAALAFSR
jgi:hypothetical protein